jgi:hypothetical protein
MNDRRHVSAIVCIFRSEGFRLLLVVLKEAMG